MEGYRRVNTSDLHVGDVVIVERKHFDYKSGAPRPSDYFRAIVGQHRTVAGEAFRLTGEPDWEFPQIPPWAMGWIYAGNGAMEQMWMREGNKHG